VVEYKLSKSANISSSKLFSEILKFEKYSDFLPQIQEVEILEKSDGVIKTKEKILIKSFFKKQIIQESIHEYDHNSLKSKIISGPAKNSVLDITLSNTEIGCDVNFSANLELGLKGKLFRPIISKFFKMYANGLLNKIITNAKLEEDK
tara:strand:- start:218 stop:661 length:444 start_codon:yes stop_codon:yes gene_type:complete